LKRNKYIITTSLLFFSLILFGSLPSCQEKAYRRAEKANSIPALEQFLKKYPNSKHKNSALGQIYFLAFLQASEKNTIPAYEDYLQRFPDSALRPRAIQALMRLLDPEIKKLTPEQISKMRAVIKTDFGELRVKFFPESAPETCRNFIKLARSHFYDQTQFHQVIPSYLIQAGSPTGDSKGGPGYTIKAEFNHLPNQPGAVGMARGSHPDSAGSRFYICLARIPERDGQYTIFGQVEKGLEVAQQISNQDSAGPEAEPDPYQPMFPIYLKTVKIILEE